MRGIIVYYATLPSRRKRLVRWNTGLARVPEYVVHWLPFIRPLPGCIRRCCPIAHWLPCCRLALLFSLKRQRSCDVTETVSSYINSLLDTSAQSSYRVQCLRLRTRSVSSVLVVASSRSEIAPPSATQRHHWNIDCAFFTGKVSASSSVNCALLLLRFWKRKLWWLWPSWCVNSVGFGPNTSSLAFYWPRTSLVRFSKKNERTLN